MDQLRDLVTGVLTGPDADPAVAVEIELDQANQALSIRRTHPDGRVQTNQAKWG